MGRREFERTKQANLRFFGPRTVFLFFAEGCGGGAHDESAAGWEEDMAREEREEIEKAEAESEGQGWICQHRLGRD
jgi:hypothetical protein